MHWYANLDAWIVQDGNYGDFRCGDRIALAFEFWLETEPVPAAGPTAAKRLHDATYDVVGRVVALDPEWWVLDIGGICVFQKGHPREGLAVDDVIAARLSLGVDPFDYFERLCQQSMMPPLIYTWTVGEIQRQTAPFVSEGRMRLRDSSQLGWESVEQTDAWADDEGHAWYVLQFERIDAAPRRTRTLEP